MKHFKHRFFFIIIIIFSCYSTGFTQIIGDSRTEAEKEDNAANWSRLIKKESYSNLIKKQIEKRETNDAVLLGFHLGWSRSQANNYTKSLIKKEMISEKRAQNFILTFGADSVRSNGLINWEGYEYDLKVAPATFVKGIITYSFNNNKLTHLKFFLVEKCSYSTIFELLKKQYSSPAFQDVHNDLGEANPIHITTWLNGKKEIQLLETGGNVFIQYSDLESRYKNESYSELHKVL